MEKNSGSVEYQYGDSFRVARGCARASAGPYSNDKSSLEKVEGGDSMKLSNQMMPSMKMTIVVEKPGNPSENDRDGSMNVGDEAGIKHTDGVDHANVNEMDSKIVCPTSILMPTLKGNAESHSGFEEELIVSNLEAVQAENRADGLYNKSLNAIDKPMDDFGPFTTRPKTTWTRISRMDFGLGGLARAITLPSLGKRDVRETSSGQTKEHETKRGRVLNEEDNVVDISAGVDSHPCQEQ